MYLYGFRRRVDAPHWWPNRTGPDGACSQTQNCTRWAYMGLRSGSGTDTKAHRCENLVCHTNDNLRRRGLVLHLRARSYLNGSVTHVFQRASLYPQQPGAWCTASRGLRTRRPSTCVSFAITLLWTEGLRLGAISYKWHLNVQPNSVVLLH